VSLLAGSAGASLIFWLLLPLVLTIAAWIFATRWVNRRMGTGWAIGLGLTIIPVGSYAAMFSLAFGLGRLLIWLGLG